MDTGGCLTSRDQELRNGSRLCAINLENTVPQFVEPSRAGIQTPDKNLRNNGGAGGPED